MNSRGLHLPLGVSVEEGSGEAPVAVAAAFGCSLRYFHGDGVFAGLEVAKVDVFGVGYRSGAPVGTAEVR